MAETIDRLLNSAENGMRLRGYHAVSFRDLAEELGIKSASVHYYYRTKEDLGLKLVQRYSTRFFEDLEKRAAKAKTPKARVTAFCKTYQQALKGSDKICLCGMLGAENSGLPKNLSREVAVFFEANIAWVSKALPANMPTIRRQAKATQIVATLQGAMMLATNLHDLKTFDAVVDELLLDF